MDKDIPYIETLPSHWRIIQNRFLFRYDGHKVGDAYDNYQLLSLTTGGVKERDINASGGKVPTSYDNYQTVKKGQMVFCLFDLDCSAVFSGISNYNGMITSAYDVFSSTEMMDNSYADYWFKYVFSNRYYKMFSKSIRYTITGDMFRSLKTPVPPIEEQKRISEFLLNQETKVDTLIATVQVQIEKLKAYKQSLIAEAVTKGLDPTVPMKESGIYNIGEIPEGWKVRRLKTLATICNGKEVPSQDGNIPVYGSGGVFKYTDTILHSGISMLYGRKGTIDRPLLVDGDFWTVDTMFYTSEIHDIEPKYLYYCSVTLIDFPYYKTGSVLPSMTQTELGRVWVTYPPTNKQLHIIDYLDEKTSQIDRLIALKEAKIAKLEQYKKSLIYEYVTGKKEVS